MRVGKPKKLRLKKSYKRKMYGPIAKGAKSPKQIPATLGRRQVARTKTRRGGK